MKAQRSNNNPDHRRLCHFFALGIVSAVAVLLGLSLLVEGSETSPVAPGWNSPTVGEDGRFDHSSVAMRLDEREPERTLLEPELSAGHYTAPIGSRMSYVFDLSSRYRVEATGEGASQDSEASAMTVAGHVERTILDRRDEQILSAVTLPSLRISSPAGPAPKEDREAAALLAVAGQRLLVRFGTDGRLLGYGFPNGMNAEQRNLARSILGAFAFIVPIDREEAWETEEFDVTGHFLARYRRLTSSDEALLPVRREKLRYTAMASQGNGVPKHHLEGFAQADLSRDIGWLAGASIDEGCEMELAGLPMRVFLRVAGKLELREARMVTVTSDEIDWAAANAPAGGHLEDLSAMAEASEQETWRSLLQGVSLQDLLAELTALLNAGKYDSQEAFDAVRKLMWLARLAPEVAGQIEQMLVEGSLTEDVSHWVLAAMANAGTIEAQQMLTSLYVNPGLSETLRQSVALSMFDVLQPRPELVAAVATKLGSMSNIGVLEEASLLALGVLATRERAGRVPLATLFRLEDRVRRLGATDLWLEALGNVGGPEVFARVQRYLSDPSVDTRASAVSALRDVNTPEATKAIAEMSLRDASPRMRARAVKALAQRTGSSIAAVLCAIAQNDRDPGVQSAAVVALGRHPGQETKRVLSILAARANSVDLRALARRVLESSV